MTERFGSVKFLNSLWTTISVLNYKIHGVVGFLILSKIGMPKRQLWGESLYCAYDGLIKNYPNRSSLMFKIKLEGIIAVILLIKTIFYPLHIFNSFIELQFTYCLIHLFKKYNSMVLNIFTGLCNHTTVNVRTFPQSKRKPYPLAVTSYIPPAHTALGNC